MTLRYNFTIFIAGIADRPKQSNMDGKPESKRLQNLQSFQVYLLRYALFNFPNARRIIYSTCSLHPEENEEVIDEVLADIGNAYRLVPIRRMLKNNWTNFSSKKYNCGDACLYSKPDDDFCNGFFIAVFERNFDATLPKCKLKGGNDRNLIEVNLDVERDGVTKTTAYKREKCGKKKRKKKISTTVEQIKISASVVEFAVPEVKSKIKAKKSKDAEKMDVCSDLSNFNRELASNESKDIDIQKKTLEDVEMKKSRKKRRSKHENAFQVEKNEEIVKADDVEKQNEKTETELSKMKKKKKKRDEEMIEIDGTNGQEKKRDKELVIGLSKKRKRK